MLSTRLGKSEEEILKESAKQDRPKVRRRILPSRVRRGALLLVAVASTPGNKTATPPPSLTCLPLLVS